MLLAVMPAAVVGRFPGFELAVAAGRLGFGQELFHLVCRDRLERSGHVQILPQVRPRLNATDQRRDRQRQGEPPACRGRDVEALGDIARCPVPSCR